MEYLMTYGWAILVVMIVGVVMWQLGIFNMGSTSLTFSGFSKIKPQLAGTALDSTGAANIIFTNGAGATIDPYENTVSIAGLNDEDTCMGTIVPSGGDNVNSIAVGSNFLVTATGCVSGSRGSVYQIRVIIPYDVDIGGITTAHTETGIIRGPYE